MLARRTRLILGCMGDVQLARRRVARAWRRVRAGWTPAAAYARELWKAQARLASTMRLLALAWECCVRREGAELPC